MASGLPGKAKVNILLNQVVVWIEVDREWDVFDLRNVVKNILQNNLAMLSYLKGYAYELEITRVLNPNRGVDYVFGIGIPCIEERGKLIDLDKELAELRGKMVGADGVFVGRCLNDLVSSMKHSEDTGFYCYRAIESLRHHCASTNGISTSDKATQWEKFREISGSEESVIRLIKEAADPLRHGEVSSMTSDKRAELFNMTWNVVGGYLKKI